MTRLEVQSTLIKHASMKGRSNVCAGNNHPSNPGETPVAHRTGRAGAVDLSLSNRFVCEARAQPAALSVWWIQPARASSRGFKRKLALSSHRQHHRGGDH